MKRSYQQAKPRIKRLLPLFGWGALVVGMGYVIWAVLTWLPVAIDPKYIAYEEVNEYRTTLLLVLAGLGAAFGLYVAWRRSLASTAQAAALLSHSKAVYVQASAARPVWRGNRWPQRQPTNAPNSPKA
jgi:phosphate/sulfate permease